MRETKFRAWDYADKCMKEDISIPLLYEAYKNDVALTLNDIFSRPLGLDIMQYTGLLDSNGVEIYEGDIVKRTGRDGMERGIVRWNFCSFQLGGRVSLEGKDLEYIIWPSDYFEDYEDNSLCEVIGNVHENKDLTE